MPDLVPSESGVVLWKRALSRHRRHHRSLSKLGQLPELVPRLGVKNALASLDNRPLCRKQHPGRLTHVLRVAGRPPRLDRIVTDGVVGNFSSQDVARYIQQNRTGAANPQLAERAPHHVGNALDQVNLPRPLGDLFVAAAWTESGMHAVTVPSGRRGQQQNRNRVRVGLGDAGECVLRARPGLHGEYARSPTIGHAAVPVGKVHAHPLLPKYERPDSRPGRRLF